MIIKDKRLLKTKTLQRHHGVAISNCSAVQINSDSDETRQIFVKIRFNLKSQRNYLTNNTLNTKYDLPLPL